VKLSLAPDGSIALESALVSLRGLRPVLNGEFLPGDPVTLRAEPAGEPKSILAQYAVPAGGTFTIEIALVGTGRCDLRCRVEDLPETVALDVFGLRFGAVENLRAFLRSGYTSWDGSQFIETPGGGGEEATGYALTQLLPRYGTGSVIVGFDRHDRFQQTFTVDARTAPPSLTILTHWDRKARGAGAPESERLVIFESGEVEEALREWARIVAAAAPVPPRFPAAPITGWCSWYNLYAAITEENVLEHLRGTAEVARREGLPMRVFQLDDGFTPEMGDWLDVRPQFPRGIKPLLDDIRAAGFVPGLWIAPFLVGNRSRLYREHPDWVMHDRQTGGPLAVMTFYGEFRWHKRSEEYYTLDATHPDALDYLRRVFHTWRHEWGCEYFKTDFMHFPTVFGPDRAAWHAPGRTRIAIWRGAAEMIREAIGDATWLGCGCPLWASVGLVDAIRIGRDVGVQWAGERSALSLLRDQELRGFANHILWESDPDCILLREQFHHLTDAELRSLAIYAGMAAGVVMTSDALHHLSADRLRLWKLVLSPRAAVCRSPLLGQVDDPVRVQVRTSRAAAPEWPAALFFFNTGDHPVQRMYSLAALGLPEPLYLYDWTARQPWPGPVSQIALTIAPHDGTLLFAGPDPITSAPDRLP